MELQLNPAQFGIEESKAADIAAQFKPMLDKMVELEIEYNQVITLPIEEASTPAKTLRLKYVKVRTGTDKIHKEQKAFYLAAGRYVDAWKNTQLFAAQGIEDKLEEIENYAANKEKERIAALQAERLAIVAPYGIEVFRVDLGNMSDEVFSNFVLGCKTAYDNKKEAERLAQEQRLAAIEAERIMQEEIRLENDRLKKEAETMRAEKEAARVAAAIEAERQASILASERAEAAKKLQAEQEAARKLAAELQAKKDAEEKELQRLEKIESERIAAEKKAAKAPVKEKLRISITALTITLPESEITADLVAKFESYKNWALNQIEQL